MYQHSGMPQEQRPPQRREHFQLYIRQEPEKARVVLKDKEKDRKPIDPPPIVQLQVFNESDLNRHFLHNPYLFMCCTLEEDPDQLKKSKDGNTSKLLGTVTSSLHRLKDPAQGNNEGGFFVFGDISVQTTGRHHLRFTLHEFDIASNQTVYITELRSAPFDVLSPRDWEGPTESTHLSRAFVDQGVRLRLRKEPRTGARQMVTRAPLPMQGPPGGPPAPLAPLSHHTNSYGSQSSQDPEASYAGQPPSTQGYPQYQQPSAGNYAYGQVYQGSQGRYPPQYGAIQDTASMSQYPGYYQRPPQSGQYSRPAGQEQQSGTSHSSYASPPTQMPPGYSYPQMSDSQSSVPGRPGYYQQPYAYQGMVPTTSSTPTQMPYQATNDPYSQYRQQAAASPASYGPYRPGQPSQAPQQSQQSQPTVPSAPATSQPHDPGYQQRSSMPSTQSSDRLPPIQVSDPDAAVASVETDQQSQERAAQGYSGASQISGGGVTQY